MSKRMWQIVAVLAGAAAMMIAQDAAKNPANAGAPKTKGVSANEAKAIRKVQDTKDPTEKIAAVDALITGFPDTTFKSWAYDQAANAAASKNDVANTEHYGDLAIEADPMRFDTMLLVAGSIAQHTRKNDLDRDMKLDKARKYVKQALDMIPMAAKPANTNVSDKDWDGFKKDETATAHGDLGLIAAAQGKWDEAATEYKSALDMATGPDQVLMVRLGNAYNESRKYSDADAILKKVEALPNLDPRVKGVADAEEKRAEDGLKSGAK